MEAFDVNQIADPAIYGDPARLQAFMTWLRTEHPVARAEPPGYRPFWVLTRHAHIREVERRADIFNAGPRSTLMPIEVEEMNRQFFGLEAGVESLVMIDGARHQELRAMTQDYFLPKNIRRLEAMVDGLADEFVGRLRSFAGGRCDIAADVVFWYPLRVAMTILGIPPADEARMLKLTHEIFGASDPAVRRPGLTIGEHLTTVVQEYAAFFAEVNARKLADPQDDVGTLIARGLEGARDLTPSERLGYYVIVATAGHDTTAASIAGGISALIDDPSLIARLRDDPALVKSFANEAIRYTAPVKHFFRTATQDYTIDDVVIRAGDHVMLNYGAATRDDAVFPDAQRFVADRTPNNHLAFGYGPHQCLGQFVAKLEIEAFFRAFSRNVTSVVADGPALYTQAAFVSGIRSLPVRLEMTAEASHAAH